MSNASIRRSADQINATVYPAGPGAQRGARSVDGPISKAARAISAAAQAAHLQISAPSIHTGYVPLVDGYRWTLRSTQLDGWDMHVVFTTAGTVRSVSVNYVDADGAPQHVSRDGRDAGKLEFAQLWLERMAAAVDAALEPSVTAAAVSVDVPSHGYFTTTPENLAVVTDYFAGVELEEIRARFLERTECEIPAAVTRDVALVMWADTDPDAAESVEAERRRAQLAADRVAAAAASTEVSMWSEPHFAGMDTWTGGGTVLAHTYKRRADGTAQAVGALVAERISSPDYPDTESVEVVEYAYGAGSARSVEVSTSWQSAEWLQLWALGADMSSLTPAAGARDALAWPTAPVEPSVVDVELGDLAVATRYSSTQQWSLRSKHSGKRIGLPGTRAEIIREHARYFRYSAASALRNAALGGVAAAELGIPLEQLEREAMRLRAQQSPAEADAYMEAYVAKRAQLEAEAVAVERVAQARSRTAAREAAERSCAAVYAPGSGIACSLGAGHAGTEHEDHVSDAPDVVAWREPSADELWAEADRIANVAPAELDAELEADAAEALGVELWERAEAEAAEAAADAVDTDPEESQDLAWSLGSYFDGEPQAYWEETERSAMAFVGALILEHGYTRVERHSEPQRIVLKPALDTQDEHAHVYTFARISK